MNTATKAIFKKLFTRYPSLTCIEDPIGNAIDILIESYSMNGKLLICGNGGSAADAMHIVGELMKSFRLARRIPKDVEEKIRAVCEDADILCQNLQGGLPAISLVSEPSLQTAYANDMAPELCFAQMVYGHGKPGDVLLAISTSGNSRNILYAADVARAMDLHVIGLTGDTGGKLKDRCDVLINVPCKETYQVQELHLPIYHTLCLALENEFFGDAQ